MPDMWNPIDAVKAKYPDMGLSDAQIFSNLSDPAKFRSAFPEYTGLSDNDIRTNMQKIGLTRPDLQAPPPAAGPGVPQGQRFGLLDTARLAAGAVVDPQSFDIVTDAAKRGMQQTEQTDLASQPNDGMLTSLGKGAANVALGAMKGGVESGIGLDNLARTVTGTDRIPIPDELQPHTTTQKFGSATESVAEFMLGDAALKSLGLADKFAEITKITKWVKQLETASPLLGKALEIGLNAVRQGAVGGGQALLKGEDLGDAATTGLITGAVGAGADVVTGGLGTLAGAVSNRLAKVVGAPTADTVDAGLRMAGRQVNKDAQLGMPFRLPTGGPDSVRSIFEEVSDKVLAKAKGMFQEVDAATGNQLSPVQNELRGIGYKLREADEATSAALLERKAVLEAKQEALFQQAQTNGVDPKVLDQARAAWKQGSALDDVDRAVKLSTKGLRPDMAERLAAEHPGLGFDSSQELVDPKQLFNRLNKLNDSGRLADAFGGNSALVDDILGVLNLAQQPKVAPVFQQVITSLVQHGAPMAGGGLLGYKEGGVAGAVAGTVAGASAPMVVGKLLSSPTTLKVLRWGLEKGASSQAIWPAVANAWQMEASKPQVTHSFNPATGRAEPKATHTFNPATGRAEEN